VTSSTSRRRSTTPPPHAKGLLDQLEKSFLYALRSGEGEATPAALLWADADKQWAALVARLQTALPHLFVLGTYDGDDGGEARRFNRAERGCLSRKADPGAVTLG
jgi:hypothetical protein